MYLRILVMFLMMFILNVNVQAIQCSEVFSDGLQNNHTSGTITLGWQTRIINSPDNILDSQNSINDNTGGNSCDSGDCVNSGNIAQTININNFGSGGMGDVILGYQEERTITPGSYRNLDLGYHAILTLSPGDYYFNGTFKNNSQKNIIIAGNNSALVRIFVKGLVTLGYASGLNANGNADNLLLYSNSSVVIKEEVQVSGFIYSMEDVNLGHQSHTKGAVNAKNITTQSSGANLTFIDTPLNFGDFCDGTVVPIADYRFDETEYNDIPNEVIDSIGGYNGQAKNSEPTEGVVCNAIDLSATGISDYVVLDENILTGKNDFSISLWTRTNKKSNQSFLSGAGATNNELLMWFTSDTNFGPFLKDATNGGVTTPSIADDDWHHLVWTREGNQSCIFVDKELKGCLTQSSLPLNIQSLILGQEQDSVGGGFVSAQAFDGLIDELLVFDEALSSADISIIYDNQNAGLNYDGSTRNCPISIFPSPVLDLHFDETTWSAPNSIIDISGNGYHGNAVNAVPTLSTEGAICRAADLSVSGINDYITLDSEALNNRNHFSISLWYKTSKVGTQSLISGSSAASFNELIFWFTSNTSFSPYLKNNIQTITTNNIADNNWHHLVWTRSNTKNKFYRDGVLQLNNVTLPSGMLNISSLILGQEQDSLGGSFEASQSVEGLLDELLVFNKALTASQVQTVFNNQSVGLNFDASPRNCPSLPEPLFNMQFDEPSWSGVVGEVVDQAGNFNAQAINGATTANSAPALIGNPGTCGYGTFDGVNDYVALPTTFENQQNSITITAWINPKNTNTGSRIFADDENNSRGYAFSLGDPGSGKLRFYSRGVNPVSVDTLNSVISTNTWTFVAAVHDSVAKTRKIYVNGVAQTVTGGETSNIYTGNWGVDTGIATIGGESDSGETGNRFTGAIDEVRLYQGALTQAELMDIQNETHPCAVIDHFEINHDGQGLTCQTEDITIKACADIACTSLYMGTSDVALSINGVLEETVTVSGGSTTTSFSYLDSITPATLSLDQTYTCKNGGSTSCNIAFAQAGFILDINGSDDVASCDDSKSLAIKAVKLSDNGVSCAPAFTGNQSLNFAFNYQNPITGSKVAKLSGTDMAAAGVNQNRTITFNGNGEASLPIQYDDAGQLSFSVAEVISSGVSSATIQNVFYPSKLVVSTALNSTDSNGTVKQVAGEYFPVNIIAQCQEGTVTANYSPQSTNTLQLSVQQKEPIANNGVLTIDSVSGSTNIGATNLATTTWGNTNQNAVNFNAQYSEVGIINLAAQDLNYFGNTIASTGYSSAGRFIPDHFDVVITNSSFDNTCTAGTADFTYIGQPFTYAYLNPPEILITAKNKSGQTTKNYTESGYQKLSRSDIDDQRTFPTADTTKNGKDNLVKMQVLPTTDVGSLAKYSDGEMKYTFNAADTFTYVKNANALVASFSNMQYDIAIAKVEDADGVNAGTALTVSPLGVNLRFGRWSIENSFGPETTDLPLSMAIEYWNGSAFAVNTDDNCSVFDGDTAANYSLTLTALNNPLPAINLTPLSGQGSFVLGLAELKIAKPSDGSQGQIRFTYDITPAWLQYDWSWNGIDIQEFNENPTAVATFGQFRGNDRIIYQREVR